MYTHFKSIHLLIDTGCFHSLAIVNNTTTNMGMFIFLRGDFFFVIDPEGLMDHMVNLLLIFEEAPHFSSMAV
jgi:hypothetical protein